MAAVHRSAQAELDLADILRELDKKNPAVADRYATEFDQKSHVLTQFPELGRLRPEIAPKLRSTLVKPYVIFYRLEGDVVQIVRIIHGKRDLRRILQEDAG